MNRRYSRAHQILKNAGVINSTDEESDNSDIIENTPNASPMHCNEEKAKPTHLEVHYPSSIQACGVNEKCTAVSSYIHDKETEVGEISIEAPAYSPLTPRPVYGVGERSVEVSDIISPLPFVICPTVVKTSAILVNSPSSSPVPDMSPATSKVFHMLIGAEQDSDDSVADPNYEVEYNDIPCDDSSDDQNEYRNKHVEQNYDGSESPSILTEVLDNVERQDGPDFLALQNIEDQENLKEIPKKRKVRNPSTWKTNIEKHRRLKGESYKTKNGIIKQARPINQAKCALSTKHKCISQIPEDERIKIYTQFRNLKSLHDQRQFIINHVIKKQKNRATTEGLSRRNYTLAYTLTVAGEKIKVCREFFLATLNISGGFVKGALNKINSEGILTPDCRGKKVPPNKLSSEDETFIRDHILSYPAVESHYCRQNSEMRYLDASLNIATLYKEYVKLCETKSMKPVSSEKYRLIFRTYKLNFHKPKKDLCKHCIAYKEMNIKEKAEHQEIHALHLSRKDEARKCRDEDKEQAQTDDKTLSFNFDLEAVLSTPKGAAGPFFYVRKLAVYNLTVYNLGNRNVECYMWDETEGKRGSIEISTCIHTYIMAHNDIKNVKMMSDGCGGQQKNYHFSSMCLLTVTQHPTLNVIDHKFFETGHTHMECDSIHSKIETKAKNVPVYTPDGWAQLVRLARTNPKPFNVTTLTHDDFKDFGARNQYLSKISNGRKLGIHDAVWLQYRKEDPDKIFIKDTYDKNIPFQEIHLKKKRGKTVVYPVSAYSQRLKISSQKKNDLIKLCQDGQIPRIYHPFYENLPSSETVKDCLPEPDVTEDSE
ncbi:hypothetical protein HF086_012230 [Spodoptera exigua]|uniref:Uncharacterized protein n=1 Tax=Spodoptera exigua TaxID=7107 RepID=A0A922SEI4_SPOEX|nr:hypothetical protein HF086_012230 [Spodoptera exigua]